MVILPPPVRATVARLTVFGGYNSPCILVCMTINRKEALKYHKKLPDRLWEYLRTQGFSDDFIHRKLLGFDGSYITVPVFDHERKLSFFEYLTDPDEGPIQVVDHKRSEEASLYGWDTVDTRPDRLILVKGAWDRLVLLSRGIPAVAIVGDPTAFNPEWAAAFQGIAVALVFPRTGQEYREARAVSEIIGMAPVCELPFHMSAYPPALRSVAGFFLHHQGTRKEFFRLLPPSDS